MKYVKGTELYLIRDTSSLSSFHVVKVEVKSHTAKYLTVIKFNDNLKCVNKGGCNYVLENANYTESYIICETEDEILEHIEKRKLGGSIDRQFRTGQDWAKIPIELLREISKYTAYNKA